MSDNTDPIAVTNKPSPAGRLVILAFGVPALVVWGLVLRYVLPLLPHVAGLLPAAAGSANGGRVLYAFLVCLAALAGAALSAGMLARVWKGKAPVWSAPISLSLAIFGFLLVGLIGD